MIDMEIKIGDRVKVVDQEIRGEGIRYDGQKIVILDDEPGQDLEDGDEPLSKLLIFNDLRRRAARRVPTRKLFTIA